MPITTTHIHPLDLEQDIAVGLNLPLNSNNTSFFKLNYTTKKQIQTNLKMLLMTIPGERPMRPNYGTNIRKILFEQDNSNLIQYIKDDVNDSIDEYLPYITVEQISITKDSNRHLIYITINYYINATKEIDEVVVTI